MTLNSSQEMPGNWEYIIYLHLAQKLDYKQVILFLWWKFWISRQKFNPIKIKYGGTLFERMA